MRIGIVGFGIGGRTLGPGFIKHGHQVRHGTREPNQQEVRDWAARNADSPVGTFSEAAAFGDLLRKQTKQRRLMQMLEELKLGDVYMNMTYNPTRRRNER